VDRTQLNSPKTEKSRPNPTQPMGQPNPWTVLARGRIYNRQQSRRVVRVQGCGSLLRHKCIVIDLAVFADIAHLAAANTHTTPNKIVATLSCEI